MDYLVRIVNPPAYAALRLENTDSFFERALAGYLFYGGFDELDMEETAQEVEYFSRDPHNPDILTEDIQTVMSALNAFHTVPENLDTLAFLDSGIEMQDVTLVNKNELTWIFKVTV